MRHDHYTPSIRWQLPSLWIIANTLAWIVGYSVVNRVLLSAVKLIPIIFVYAFLSVLVGLIQWVVLRRTAKISSLWVLISSIEMTTILYFSEVAPPIRWIQSFILQIMFGTIIGISQWFLMRKYFHHSGWWIIANCFGWFLGWSLGLAGNSLEYLIGSVASVFTGLTLLILSKD